MSEYFVPMIVCDRCMPGLAPVVVDGVYDVEVTEGYCVGLPLDTALSMGWQEIEPGMHYCPACVRAEQEDAQASMDVDHGAMQLGVFYDGGDAANKENE